MLCSVARAGSWALVSCSTPAGQPAPIDGWLAGGAGDEKGSLSTCNSPGGAMIAQVGDQVEQTAYQPATWTFTAPLGSTIAGWHAHARVLHARGAGLRRDAREQLRQR